MGVGLQRNVPRTSVYEVVNFFLNVIYGETIYECLSLNTDKKTHVKICEHREHTDLYFLIEQSKYVKKYHITYVRK